MLDINFIEANQKEVIKRLNSRNTDYTTDVQKAIELNHQRKLILIDVEKLKSDRNNLSKTIGELVRAKKNDEVESIKTRVGEINQTITRYDEQLKEINYLLEHLLRTIPNLPDAKIKVGIDDNDNQEIRRWGDEKKKEQTVPHWEIAPKLNLVDFDLGAKLSGSRFVVYTNKGAKMVRVLADLLIQTHTNHDYQEMFVPVIVNQELMYGTGQLPKFADDAYATGNQYLIPTAEVPLTNIHAHEILDLKTLPKKYVAFSQCFRQEAGSAGRDTKGLIRLHQFNKVELVKIVEQESSAQELELLVEDVQAILELFDLPYRVVELCTGDLGFSATKTYDLEVWFPSQNKYREISSCSNCGDFQARNMMIRYKDNNETKLAHTLNGSGVAIDRLIAAILENYYDGEKLVLPAKLQPYFNGEKFLK